MRVVPGSYAHLMRRSGLDSPGPRPGSNIHAPANSAMVPTPIRTATYRPGSESAHAEVFDALAGDVSDQLEVLVEVQNCEFCEFCCGSDE